MIDCARAGQIEGRTTRAFEQSVAGLRVQVISIVDLLPHANGEMKAAIAITEPGAGSDPAGMKTRAQYKNGKWVINGQKIFISHRWFIARDLLRHGLPAD